MAEIEIGGREFKVGHVLATESVILQARLLQIIGGGLDRLPVILGSRVEGATDEMKAMGDAAAVAALGDIVSKCDPKVIAKLITDIVSYAAIHRPSGAWEKADLDGDFTEHKSDIFPLVIFVLREVLGDFFSGLLASGALKKLASKG